jgi:hypothetical protein
MAQPSILRTQAWSDDTTPEQVNLNIDKQVRVTDSNSSPLDTTVYQPTQLKTIGSRLALHYTFSAKIIHRLFATEGVHYMKDGEPSSMLDRERQ